jgi:hypothetical protein
LIEIFEALFMRHGFEILLEVALGPICWVLFWHGELLNAKGKIPNILPSLGGRGRRGGGN